MSKVKNIETGEIQEVADSNLGALLETGRYAPEEGARVAVVDELGKIGTIDASEYMSKNISQAGMRIATPQEVEEQRKEQEYGNSLATLQATAEGVARGTTVGLSDLLLKNLGVSAEGLRERKERNPIASTTGEVGGVIGSAVFTGGAFGVAGTGAKTAAGRLGAGLLGSTPAGLVARGGMAAEEGLARLVGEGVLRKALTTAAVGAGEGAIYGAGEAVSESALGDHELTAERLLASAGKGALWGGGGAGLASLLSSGVKAGVSKIRPQKIEEVDRQLMKDFGIGGKAGDVKTVAKIEDSIAENSAKAARELDNVVATAEQKGAVKRYLAKADEFVQNRRAFRKLDDTLDSHAEDITRRVSRLEEIRDKTLYDDLIISNKIKTMARVAREDPAIDLVRLGNHIDESMTKTWQKYNNIINNTEGVYSTYETGVVKRYKGNLDKQLFRAKKLVREGDPADSLEELLGLWDQSKRDVGNITENLGKYENRIMGKELKSYYVNELRADMIDEGILGKASEIQKAWNSAWEQDLDVKSAYDRFFLADAGGKKKTGGFGQVKVGDINKIKPAIRGAAEDLNLYNTILRRSAKAQSELLETLSKYNAFVDEKTLRLAQEARDISDEILISMDNAASTSLKAGAYKKAIEEAEDIPLWSRVVKTFAWAADRGYQLDDKLISGKIQATINEAIGKGREQSAVIRSINKKTSSAANVTKRAVDGFFSAGKRAKRAIAPIAATQADKKQDINTRYKETIKRHSEVLSNIPLIAEKAGSIVDSRITPNTSLAMSTTAVNAASFLRSKQPTPNTKPSDVFAHLDDRQRVADSEIAKYLRYVDGVENPMDAIRQFGETGDMPRETAEAIRTVYPKLFEEFETKITERIIDATEPLPYVDLMRLSTVLGRAMHPSLEGSYIAMCQSAHRARANEMMSPSRRSMPDTSKNYKTQGQRLMS